MIDERLLIGAFFVNNVLGKIFFLCVLFSAAGRGSGGKELRSIKKKLCAQMTPSYTHLLSGCRLFLWILFRLWERREGRKTNTVRLFPCFLPCGGRTSGRISGDGQERMLNAIQHTVEEGMDRAIANPTRKGNLQNGLVFRCVEGCSLGSGETIAVRGHGDLCCACVVGRRRRRRQNFHHLHTFKLLHVTQVDGPKRVLQQKCGHHSGNLLVVQRAIGPKKQFVAMQLHPTLHHACILLR